ncbi:MAG TPA: diacylglycerol kinase family protein [Chthoniobacteraceae bacterium]|nr:diacylglycerol kinase family protein [Chthoniobacteraceae bacterium]
MNRSILILNPTARSGRARGLRRRLGKLIGSSPVLVRETAHPGQARSIAQWAVGKGYRRVIAAGGDGTVNEIINGIAGSDLSLGLLPVGTMNVFAAELGLPRSLERCWEIIEADRTCEVDLPLANGHAFIQLAGVGLDAQVIRETSHAFKRHLGPLSYLISATQIASRKPPRLTIRTAEGTTHDGSFVLVGNGRFYGGPFPVFPEARSHDGLLDVILFQNLGYLDIARYLQAIFFRFQHQLHDVVSLQTRRLQVSADMPVPVEVDGEVIGDTPIDFHFHPKPLRIVVPASYHGRGPGPVS